MEPGEKLRKRLAQKEILVLPGVYDALTAKIAVAAGFDGTMLEKAIEHYEANYMGQE